MTALETAPSPTPLPLRIGRTPVALGILLALIGFGIGVAIVAIVRTIIGFDAWDTNQSWTSGYIVALMGWLAGVGGWRYWGREFVGLEVDTYETKGWARYFGFSPDHKVIGIQYIVTFIVLFLIGGLVAMLLRGELTQTGTQILSGNDYNATMSFHGISMVAVAVALLIGGLGNYVVPIMIGARDMAFPRLNALSYWL
ncbi:MAG TPA: cbb3-type cytochrome c oxidase subunit I, partial [Dehalococcoidia bacterium]|nr:cbb3-type cytochrome c oxidase subunit I [Dehalococcoidia bacterium]